MALYDSYLNKNNLYSRPSEMMSNVNDYLGANKASLPMKDMTLKTLKTLKNLLALQEAAQMIYFQNLLEIWEVLMRINKGYF